MFWCPIIAAASFVAGAVVGKAATGRDTRSVVRAAIKGSLVTGKKIQTVASEMLEDLSDIATEAQAEIDGEPEGGTGP